MFQALVAGVARRGELVVGDDVPSNKNVTPVGRALGWLQRHTRDHPPIIIAPRSTTGQAITRFVPNNDGDKKFDRQERLTGKYTEPTLFLLEPDQKPEVHYVWDVTGTNDCPVADIERAARSLTTLGWGIDMAFADARRYVADIDYMTRVRPQALLDKEYLKSRAKLIDLERAQDFGHGTPPQSGTTRRRRR